MSAASLDPSAAPAFFRCHTRTTFLKSMKLALSFRTSASYERFSERRKYWASLQLASHNLARVIWSHAREREGELGK